MQLSIYPAEILRRRAVLVPDPAAVHDWIDPMAVVMREQKGVGIAAPQIGMSERFFLTAVPRDELRVFVNPEIIDCSSRSVRSQESCLSLPGLTAEVPRHAWVTVAYFNTNGVRHELNARGLLARVIQHELDHLNGVLFTDYLRPKRRERLLKGVVRTVAAHE
jgi:peptide deformylase